MMPTQEQLNELEKQFRYTGVRPWLDAGRTGISPRTKKPIVVWVTESVTDHSTATSDMVRFVSPNCKIIRAATTGSSTLLDYTVTYNGVTYTPDAFIKAFNVKILSVSIGGTAEDGETPKALYWKDICDRNKIIILNAAGNASVNGACALMPSLVAQYIGACGWTDKGTLVKKNYSSVDPEVDYINFTGFLEGTSLSCPYTAGEVANIVAFYEDNMDPQEIIWYLDSISKSIVAGTDQDGRGLPFLPAPGLKYIRFRVGYNQYQVDDEVKTMDTTPVNINGTVFVPLRACCEALGKEVTWDEPTKTATIIDDNGNDDPVDDITMKLTLGSATALIDDDDPDQIFDQVQMIAAPFRDAAGRTMVPLRFISENFNCKVGWIQSLKKVLILELPEV